MVTMVQSKSNAISFMLRRLIKSSIWATRCLVEGEEDADDGGCDCDEEDVEEDDENMAEFELKWFASMDVIKLKYNRCN